MLYLGQAKYIISDIVNIFFETLYRILLDYCMGGNSFVSFVNKYLKDDEEHIKQRAKENLLKSKIFLVIGFIIECDLSINNDNKIQNVNLTQGLIQILKIIFLSLDYIIKEELSNLEEYYKEANYEIIIYQAFSLFNKCICVSPFKEDFYGSAKDFIFFKIFPFFTLDLGEMELFKESPEEYYLQIIDTMTDFNFKKIKTICGKSLTLICENYPDLSFTVLNTIFELLIFFMEEFGRRNLDKYTFGEYSKNRNLRIIVKKFIQFYLSSFTIKKKEKIFDVNLSSIYPLKSTNVDYGFTSYPSLYSETKKLNIPEKNASNSSLNKCLSKKIGNNSNEGQYLIIFNSNNNSFNFLGKNIKKRLSVPGYNIKNTNELWINNFKENFAYKNDLFYKNFSKINEFSNKINNNEILFCDNEKEFNSVYNNNKLINKTFET